MKKYILATLALPFCVFLAAINFPINPASAKTNSAKPPLPALRMISGAQTPELIPDHAAQEAFLRSLTADPDDEVGQQRARAFAEQTGLDPESVDALLLAAQEFVRKAKPLDDEANKIKDDHWPHPDATAMGRLAGLQGHKEALIAQTIGKLTGRFAKYRATRLTNFIKDRVKRGISSSVEPPPTGHGMMGLVGGGGLLRGFGFPASLAAQYMGEEYLYSNIYRSGTNLYSYGATQQNYSSYGHKYRITLTTTHPDGGVLTTTRPPYAYQSSPLSITDALPLKRGGIWWDGNAFATTSGIGHCPVVNQTFNMQQSSTVTPVTPSTLR